jgi:hypothetical protein
VAMTKSPTSGQLGLRSAIYTISDYSSTAWTSPLIIALPPVGCAKFSPQTLHVITLVVLLKISCSLLHFGHFTRRKTLRGLGISLFHSDIFS